MTNFTKMLVLAHNTFSLSRPNCDKHSFGILCVNALYSAEEKDLQLPNVRNNTHRNQIQNKGSLIGNTDNLKQGSSD